VGEIQETPLRKSPSVVEALGLGTMAQLVPSQLSMRVSSVAPVATSPTAMHAVDDTHDTLLRPSRSVAEALGLGTTAQLVPFHVSMSVCPAGEVLYVPTAMHAVDDVQKTPLRELLSTTELLGSGRMLGLGTMAQLVPAQFSMSV